MTNQKLTYEVKIEKNSQDFTFNEVLEWVKASCSGNWRYYNRKNHISFRFNELNDAFKFKLKWTFA